jgi:FKBP-type peptidyl-prolyl cis-trans isomerase SlyD
MIELDLNHPLAGETLNFDVKIIALRLPTEEELEHGHIHSHGGEKHNEDFDEEFLDAADEEE